MAALELSAHMTVRPGRLEGFKRQAAELIRITQEKDTHTLRYDCFSAWMGLNARFARRTPVRKDSSNTTAIFSTPEPCCSRTTPTITS